MNVNKNQSPIVIGIDHGYGNIKTASSCFRTSVKAYDTEPTFTSNMLVYNGRYYIIGEGHKEFIPEKQNDDDYYILTLPRLPVSFMQGTWRARRSILRRDFR